MKKFLSFVFFCMVSVSAFADKKIWDVIEVSDGNIIAGYVLQTRSVGTVYGSTKSKEHVSFRLVCSPRAGYETTIIGIVWDNIPEVSAVNVYVDNSRVLLSNTWDSDGPLTFRTLSGSKPLVESMKTGKMIKVELIGVDSVRRVSIFNLDRFKEYFSTFESACKR